METKINVIKDIITSAISKVIKVPIITSNITTLSPNIFLVFFFINA